MEKIQAKRIGNSSHYFWIFQNTLRIFLFLLVSGCIFQKDNSIAKRIQPVSRQSGFKMNGYWIWGGSVIKVDSVYHMFASRWPKNKEFPVDYYENSEIVRATSKTLTGPYKFQEVVIGERDSAFWDSNMAHNPSIYKIDNEYILFYIGSDFTTMQPGSKNYMRRIGYATASSIEGLWHRSDKPVINEESNNPAILVDGNKIKLLFRDENLRLFLAEAESYSGPYQIVNDNVWPESQLEDFYLFKMGNKYHFICEDGQGSITGHERWGADLYSEDGINNWKKYKNPVAYDHDIRYKDGSVLNCIRRERPQLIIENNRITGLATAVYDGKNSWCQPVELYPPIELSKR